MSKRKWHDRAREIAARNPGALPPFMRTQVRELAWDRVNWQASLQPEVSVVALARPILLVLEWLDGRGLLAPAGKAALLAGRQGEALATLSLEPSMVLPRARSFLDRHYAQWHDAWCANLVMAGTAEMAGDAKQWLDGLWSSGEGRPTSG